MDENIFQKVISRSLDKTPMGGRIANRWVKASEESDYDLLIRLQVLEGAVGVPVGLWFGKGPRNGLAHAKKYFQDHPHPQMDSKWLDPHYSHMYGILEHRIGQAIHTYKVTKVEPRDVINNYLMGLTIDPSKVQPNPAEEQHSTTSKRVIYSTGAHYREGILNGSEKPVALAQGPLSLFLTRKVQNEARQIRLVHQMPTTEEGAALDIADTRHLDPWEILGAVAFRDLSDPLGHKLRNLMRHTWSQLQNEKSRAIMLGWLNEVESGKQHISKTELAARFGVRMEDFSAKYWSRAWLEFFKALWSNHALLHEVQLYLAAKGINWDPVKPNISEAGEDDPLRHLKRYLSGSKKVSYLQLWSSFAWQI